MSVFSWIRRKRCNHVFDYPNDMINTGYYDDTKGFDCPYLHKRIMCRCVKCHKIFFAHCGVDLPGKLVRDYDPDKRENT